MAGQPGLGAKLELLGQVQVWQESSLFVFFPLGAAFNQLKLKVSGNA